MNTPDLLSLADVCRESGASVVALFGYGLEESKPLRFFVIVPERGAYQVPRKALEHLRAGDAEYLARDMREHWSGDPLPEHLIRRDRLFVHADDWNRRMADAVELAQAIERISVPLRLGFTPVEEVANSIARAVLGVAADPPERLTSNALNPRAIRFHQELTDWLSLILRLVNEGALTLYDQGGMVHSGPFEEGCLAAGELTASNSLFVLPPSLDRTYPRRIWFEVFLPGHSLRTLVGADGSVTTGWYPDECSGKDEGQGNESATEPLPSSVRHSTKDSKTHVLSRVIAVAQSQCQDPDDYLEVFARLEVMANNEEPPLLASTAQGLKYSDQGTTKHYTRDALRKKLKRAADKEKH